MARSAGRWSPGGGLGIIRDLRPDDSFTSGRIAAGPCSALHRAAGAPIHTNINAETFPEVPVFRFLLVIIAALVVSPAATGQPLDAETLWKLQRLGPPTLSPDGKRAAFKATRYDDEHDDGVAALWMAATGELETRQLTGYAEGLGDPVWSPDGRWIAFTAKRGDDEAAQVYLLPTEGGEARAITDVPTGTGSLRWFPDSSRVAFISRVWADLEGWEAQEERLIERKDSKMTAMVWDHSVMRWWDAWIDDRQAHLFSVPVGGGDIAAHTLGTGFELPRINPGTDHFDIAPDGDEIAFVANTSGSLTEINLDILLIPAGGGEVRNVTTDNEVADFRPRYSPDGRWLTFARQTIRGFYGDTRQFMLHDRRAGGNRRLAADWDRSADGIEWSADGKTLFGAIDDAGVRRVYRFRLPDGRPTPLTGDTSFSDLAVAGDGSVLVGLEQSFVQPPALVRIDPRDGDVTRLSDLNDAVLDGVDMGTYESVTYTGANGAEIQMWINYPPGFDDGRPWPLYLLLHGGPHNAITNSFHFRWNAQVFSGWGYVTAWHNFHGSSGFGQAFTDSINPERAQKPYEDTIAAAEWFAGQDWIDADRMAAGGGSYGGYLASVLLGRDHPFKTLVAHAAVYNDFTQYGADYGAMRRRHGDFWDDPEQFRRNSPHFGAGNFDTPTLVIHGEKDYRVPLNHGIELFNTLQTRGVPSKFVYYPDENHWVLKRENSLFWYATKQSWLAEYIGSGP